MRKEKIEKLDRASTIFLARKTDKILAYGNPSRGKELDLDESDRILIESKLIRSRKDGISEAYYIGRCPERWKSQCVDEKIYISGDVLKTIDEIKKLFLLHKPIGNYGLLIESSQKEIANSTREWILNPEKQAFPEIHADTMYYVITSPYNPEKILGIVEELLAAMYVSKNPNLEDSTKLEPLRKKYGTNSPEIKERLKYKRRITAILEDIRSIVYPNVVSGFFRRADSYQGLVEHFNKFSYIPYLQEYLFSEILKESIYKEGKIFFTNTKDRKIMLNQIKELATNNVYDLSETFMVDWKLEIQRGKQLLIKSESWNKTGGIITQEKWNLISISAYSEGNTISFQVKTNQKTFQLSMVKPGKFLESGLFEYSTFLKNSPSGTYKEYFGKYSYLKAVLWSALKEGVGGFQTERGIMEYSLSSSDSYKYWVLLEVFRNNPNILRKTDYSGTFSSSHCSVQHQWRQPKGELYIGCEKEVCDLRCKSELQEEICLSEKEKGGKEVLFLRFYPDEWKSDTPKIQFYFTGSSKECNSIWNEILNR
jgi:hypothetical protein